MKKYRYSEHMLFDPNDEQLVESLSVYGEFNLPDEDYGCDREKLFRFIIIMYDMNSPMRLEYPEFWERKKVSALEAGFKVDKKGHFDDNVESFLVGDNTRVNEAIAKYVLLHGIPEYTALVVYQTGLYLEMVKTLKGIVNKQLTQNVEFLRIKIRELTDIIYGGSETINAKRALYSGIEKDRFPLPDDVVKRLNDGDDLSDYNPYGTYEVGKIKFIGDE